MFMQFIAQYSITFVLQVCKQSQVSRGTSMRENIIHWAADGSYVSSRPPLPSLLFLFSLFPVANLM